MSLRPVQQHVDSRLVLMYKVTYDLVAIPTSDYLVHNTRRSQSAGIQTDTNSERLLQIHILPTNYCSLECPTSPHTSPTHHGTVQYSCLSGVPLIPLNTNILFLSFNYADTLDRTVQTHFTYYSLLYFDYPPSVLGIPEHHLKSS